MKIKFSIEKANVKFEPKIFEISNHFFAKKIVKYYISETRFIDKDTKLTIEMPGILSWLNKYYLWKQFKLYHFLTNDFLTMKPKERIWTDIISSNIEISLENFTKKEMETIKPAIKEFQLRWYGKKLELRNCDWRIRGTLSPEIEKDPKKFKLYNDLMDILDNKLASIKNMSLREFLHWDSSFADSLLELEKAYLTMKTTINNPFFVINEPIFNHYIYFDWLEFRYQQFKLGNENPKTLLLAIIEASFQGLKINHDERWNQNNLIEEHALLMTKHYLKEEDYVEILNKIDLEKNHFEITEFIFHQVWFKICINSNNFLN